MKQSMRPTCTLPRQMLQKLLAFDLRSPVVSFKQPKPGLTQELSFFRISEYTTRYTFTTTVGSFTSPGRRGSKPDRRDHWLLVSLPNDTGNRGVNEIA